ncbi:MAG: AI-2E family transporter [Spirochaetota bacterium]
MDRGAQNILLIMLFMLIFYIMSVLQSILLPLVLALLFVLVVQPLVIILEEKRVPRAVIVPLLSVLTISALVILFNILMSSFAQILSQREFLAERLYEKLSSIASFISTYTATPIESSTILNSLQEFFKTNLLSHAAGSVATKLSTFAGSFVMFSIYYIVLLTGMSNYKRYLAHVGGEDKAELLISNYETIQKSIFSYLTIKAFISMLTGLLAGIILALFDIKFALLFAFLTFLFNFIPTIGSIIASIAPISMALIQFNTVTPAIALMFILTGVQMIMGNLVEPKLVGNKLRLNTVTVIFGLVFWGYLWGISGMIMSVPLMVTIKLAFEYIPSTRVLARIMGYPEKIAAENNSQEQS